MFARLALTACVGVLCAGVARAQLNPFPGVNSAPRLEQSDLFMMGQSAAALYQADSVADGDTKDWSNPATGATGSVTMEQTFPTTFQGRTLTCRKLRYTVRVPSRSDPATIRLSWCDDNGVWRLL